MPPAPNESASPDSDDGEPEGVLPDRDADAELPNSERVPLSDVVRTARLALQAMLGTGMSSLHEEDASPDDPMGR